ncbi:transporter substrate-binding domain-containing protein [Massilia arenosa]|uniref:Transporter substrate-binding domain-containing protein n=1 Tax=Zemynaea arenosa TaxID=2561931 RepID=A0A4Y9SG67_9BURK|nr:transporter substrate-binding domain-containing protein [Massilia arenosa]TFW22817.1 transporter substrate-binding domain-containing protein [Massilia arenosa]
MKAVLGGIALALAATSALAEELVVLVDTGTEMPMARFERGRLAAGIHKDIGDALAGALQRQARFLALPRKRLVTALAAGQADVLCSYRQEWLPGPFGWSQPFIPIDEVLIADRGVPAPRAVADVANQPVGTVLGFAHPEMTELLGTGFVREDSPSTEANLRKLAAGRMHYALIGRTFLDYHRKTGDFTLPIHPPLPVRSYMGQCAVSFAGRLPLAEVDRAISRLRKDGRIDAILARYR